MQLEQQETFEIKSPQLEVFGQVESKLPAPAKKRPFAAGFLAVMVLVSVFGIGGVQLKSRYRNVAEIYTSEVDKHGNSIQGDFTTLTDTDSQQVGNMALGGFENGVTTLEMAAAYSAFVNDGIYTTPRTYSRVEDSKGNVIIDNNTESHVAMKKTTAYLMRSILQDVVRRGSPVCPSAARPVPPMMQETATSRALRPTTARRPGADINLMRWCIPTPTHARLCSRES